MQIEDEVFGKARADAEKLQEYGFVPEEKGFVITRPMGAGNLQAKVTVSPEGTVSGVVVDLDTGDEYTAFRREAAAGRFVGQVREEYQRILEEIRGACFENRFFGSDQANRIAELIRLQYGDLPEFLWDKYGAENYGAFRNPVNHKWYGLIMDIDRKKLKDGSGACDVINVKADPELVPALIEKGGFYPAYHMNKKNWITVILDDTVPDAEIMKLIAESHRFTEDKKGHGNRTGRAV